MRKEIFESMKFSTFSKSRYEKKYHKQNLNLHEVEKVTNGFKNTGTKVPDFGLLFKMVKRIFMRNVDLSNFTTHKDQNNSGIPRHQKHNSQLYYPIQLCS